MSKRAVAKWIEINIGDSTNSGSDTILRYALGGIDITHDAQVFKANGNLLGIGNIDTSLGFRKTSLVIKLNSTNLINVANLNAIKYRNKEVKVFIGLRGADGSITTSSIKQIFRGQCDSHSVGRKDLTITAKSFFARFEQPSGTRTSSASQSYNIKNGLYDVATTTIDKGFDYADRDYSNLLLGKVPARTIEHTQVIVGPRRYGFFGPKSRTTITTVEHIPGREGEQLTDDGSDYTRPIVFGRGLATGNLIHALNPTQAAIDAVYPTLTNASVIENTEAGTKYATLVFAVAEGPVNDISVMFNDVTKGAEITSQAMVNGSTGTIKDSNGGVIGIIETILGSDSQTAMPNLVSLSPSWTTDHRCIGTALVMVTLAASDAFANGFPTFTFNVGGKRHPQVAVDGSSYSLGANTYGNTDTSANIFDRVDTTTAYTIGAPQSANVISSTSPAYAILDLLLNKAYGMGQIITTDDIDLKSFYQANVYERDQNTAQGGRYPTVCRGVLNGGKSFKEHIDSIAAVGKCNLTVIDGKVTLVSNRYLGTDTSTRSSVKTFDEGNIINGIMDIKFAPSNKVYNQITVTVPVTNSLNQETFSLTVEDANALAEDNGQKSEKILTLPMASVQLNGSGSPVNKSREIVEEIGRFALRRSRLFTRGKFDIDYWDNTTLKPGDVINISSKRYNLTGSSTLLAKVTRIVFKKNGVLSVEWSQFSNLIYDVSQTDITSVSRGAFPDEAFNSTDTFSVTGNTGLAGYSNALVRVFKKASTEPTDKPTEVATYTFDTATTSFPSSATSSNGWHTTPDGATGTGTLYARLSTAVSRDATDTIAITEWSGVNEVTSTGIDGEDGINSSSVSYFQRTATAVAPSTLPQNEATYTFSSGALTPSPNSGWYPLEEVVGTGGFLWFTTSTAASRTSTDTIPSSEWATPILLVENGKDGTDGVFGRRVYQNSLTRPTISGGSVNETLRTLTPPAGWSLTPTSGDPQRWFSETAIDFGATLRKAKFTLVCNGTTGGTTTAAVAQVNTTLYNSGTSGSDSGSSLIAEEGFFDIDGNFPAANYPTTRDSLKATFSTGSETEFTFDNFEHNERITMTLSGFTFPINEVASQGSRLNNLDSILSGETITQFQVFSAGASNTTFARAGEIVYNGSTTISFASNTATSEAELASQAAAAYQAIAVTGEGTTEIRGFDGTTTYTISRGADFTSSGDDLVITYLTSGDKTDNVITNLNSSPHNDVTSTSVNTSAVLRPTNGSMVWDFNNSSDITFPVSSAQNGDAIRTLGTQQQAFRVGTQSASLIVLYATNNSDFRLDQMTSSDGSDFRFASSTATNFTELVSQFATALQALPVAGVGTTTIPNITLSNTTTYSASRGTSVSSDSGVLTMEYLEPGNSDSYLPAFGTTTTLVTNPYVSEPHNEYYELAMSGFTFPINTSFASSGQKDGNCGFSVSGTGITTFEMTVGISNSATRVVNQISIFEGSSTRRAVLFISSTASSLSELLSQATTAFNNISTSGTSSIPNADTSNTTTYTVTRLCDVTANDTNIRFTFLSAGDFTDNIASNFGGTTSTLSTVQEVPTIVLPDYSTTSLVADRIVSQGYTGVTLTHDNTFDTGNNPLGSGDERIKFKYDTLGTQTDVTTASFVVEQGTDGTLTLEDVGIVTQGGGVTNTGDVLALTNVDTNNGHSASAASTTLANTVTGNTVRDAIVSLWSGFGGFTTNIATAGTVLATDSAAGDSTDPVFTHTPGTGSTLVVSSSVTTDGADAFTSDTNTLTINIDGVDYTVGYAPDDSSSQQATAIDTALEAESAVTDDWTIVNTGSEVVIEAKVEEPKDQLTISLDTGKPGQTATTPSLTTVTGVGNAIVWSTPEKDGVNGDTPIVVGVSISPDQFISQLSTGFYPSGALTVKAVFYHGSATPTEVDVDTVSVTTAGTLTPTTGNSTGNAVTIDGGSFTYDVTYTIIGDNLRATVEVKTDNIGIAVDSKTITLVKLGPDGAIGPRTVNGTVYYSVAQSSTPSTPAATEYDFDTREFSSLTTNWSKDPSTISASQTNSYFQSEYEIVESVYGGTYTITFTSPTSIVSFTNVLVSGGLTAQQFIKAGNLVTNNDATVQSGSGTLLNGNGDVTFGDTTNNVSWDSSEGTLTVNGTIITSNNILLDGVSVIGDSDGKLRVGTIYSSQIVSADDRNLNVNQFGSNGSSDNLGIGGNGGAGTSFNLTVTGDIVVQALNTFGGSGGSGALGGNGADGGDVTLTSTHGNINITGSINTSGGDGGSGLTLDGDGGDGGDVTLTANRGCVAGASGVVTGGGAGANTGNSGSLSTSFSVGNVCTGQ